MKICKIKDCGNKIFAKGYCHKHYTRWWRHGDPLYVEVEMHGMTGTPEYRTWMRMKQRCYNKNDGRFNRYGGRGITVCNRWFHSFVFFLSDMGLKPFPGAQIDRIDNNKGYFLENCRWIISARNGQNRSTTKLTTEKAKEIKELYGAGDITQKILSHIYKIDPSTISRIVNNKRWQIAIGDSAECV